MDSDSSPLVCDAGLDTNGLSYPLPLLKAELELNRLPSGRMLKVIATDVRLQRDFRAFVQLAGHRLLHEKATEGVYRYWLHKCQWSPRRSDSGFLMIEVLRG